MKNFTKYIQNIKKFQILSIIDRHRYVSIMSIPLIDNDKSLSVFIIDIIQNFVIFYKYFSLFFNI